VLPCSCAVRGVRSKVCVLRRMPYAFYSFLLAACADITNLLHCSLNDRSTQRFIRASPTNARQNGAESSALCMPRPPTFQKLHNAGFSNGRKSKPQKHPSLISRTGNSLRYCSCFLASIFQHFHRLAKLMPSTIQSLFENVSLPAQHPFRNRRSRLPIASASPLVYRIDEIAILTLHHKTRIVTSRLPAILARLYFLLRPCDQMN
jgi:hypothetical protein